MTPSDLLRHLCHQYQQAIAASISVFAAPNSVDVSQQSQELLKLLKMRDRIQRLIDQLAEDPTAQDLPPSLWLDLAQSDQTFRDQLAPHLATYEPLNQWRDSFKPPDRYWWWFPTAPADPQDPYSWLWGGCTIAALTISVALAQEIAVRFLTGAPGLWSSIAAIAPVAFTLLATGGALTQVGQQILESILANRGTAKHHWHKLKLALAVSLMLGLFAMHSLGLPQIAQSFNRTGEMLYQQGQWASAQNHFERALSLHPDFPEAQFNLGVLYEDYQRVDDAQTEYLKAIQGGYLPALNNLARLYIQTEDYDQAARLLRETLSRPELTQQEPELVYVLHKNLGWVRLAQGRLPEAETELLEAIRINQDLTPPRPDAHCLLAQVLQQRETAANKDNSSPQPLSPAILEQWKTCLQYANRPEYDQWEGMARTALTSTEAPSHVQ